MERFKEHRKSRKCRNGTGDQPSLNKFFSSASAMKISSASKPVISQTACPGLSHLEDPRITRYLTRTVMPGGGAPHRSLLKKQILASQRHRKKLSKRELQNRIKATERAQAAWSNDHYTGAVFSTKCTGQAVVGHSLIMPCDECRKVLHMQIFRNALRHLPPKKGNWKYTPKEYRSELLGKAYMWHIDVHEFMEEVQSIIIHLSLYSLKGASGQRELTVDQVCKKSNRRSIPQPRSFPWDA